MAEWRVALRTIQNERCHVYCPAESSVLDLKHMVAAAHGYVVESLRLCLNGAVLHDDQALRDCMTARDVLVLVGRRPPGPPPAPGLSPTQCLAVLGGASSRAEAQWLALRDLRAHFLVLPPGERVALLPGLLTKVRLATAAEAPLGQGLLELVRRTLAVLPEDSQLSISLTAADCDFLRQALAGDEPALRRLCAVVAATEVGGAEAHWAKLGLRYNTSLNETAADLVFAYLHLCAVGKSAFYALGGPEGWSPAFRALKDCAGPFAAPLPPDETLNALCFGGPATPPWLCASGGVWSLRPASASSGGGDAEAVARLQALWAALEAEGPAVTGPPPAAALEVVGCVARLQPAHRTWAGRLLPDLTHQVQKQHSSATNALLSCALARFASFQQKTLAQGDAPVDPELLIAAADACTLQLGRLCDRAEPPRRLAEDLCVLALLQALATLAQHRGVQEHLRQQADLPRWGAMWFAALDGAVDVDRRFYVRHCKAVTADLLSAVYASAPELVVEELRVALLGVPAVIQRERWLDWLPLNEQCCRVALAASVPGTAASRPPPPLPSALWRPLAAQLTFALTLGHSPAHRRATLRTALAALPAARRPVETGDVAAAETHLGDAGDCIRAVLCVCEWLVGEPGGEEEAELLGLAGRALFGALDGWPRGASLALAPAFDKLPVLAALVHHHPDLPAHPPAPSAPPQSRTPGVTLGPLLSAYGAVASLRGVPGPERRRAVGCLQAILAAWVDGVEALLPAALPPKSKAKGSPQARVPVPWLHTARAAARGLWAVCHRGGAAAAPALDPAVLLATLAALGLALPARAAGKNRHARERAARANLQASQALMQSLTTTSMLLVLSASCSAGVRRATPPKLGPRSAVAAAFLAALPDGVSRRWPRLWASVPPGEGDPAGARRPCADAVVELLLRSAAAHCGRSVSALFGCAVAPAPPLGRAIVSLEVRHAQGRLPALLALLVAAMADAPDLAAYLVRHCRRPLLLVVDVLLDRALGGALDDASPRLLGALLRGLVIQAAQELLPSDVVPLLAAAKAIVARANSGDREAEAEAGPCLRDGGLAGRELALLAADAVCRSALGCPALPLAVVDLLEPSPPAAEGDAPFQPPAAAASGASFTDLVWAMAPPPGGRLGPAWACVAERWTALVLRHPPLLRRAAVAAARPQTWGCIHRVVEASAATPTGSPATHLLIAGLWWYCAAGAADVGPAPCLQQSVAEALHAAAAGAVVHHAPAGCSSGPTWPGRDPPVLYATALLALRGSAGCVEAARPSLPPPPAVLPPLLRAVASAGGDPVLLRWVAALLRTSVDDAPFAEQLVPEFSTFLLLAVEKDRPLEVLHDVADIFFRVMSCQPHLAKELDFQHPSLFRCLLELLRCPDLCTVHRTLLALAAGHAHFPAAFPAEAVAGSGPFLATATQLLRRRDGGEGADPGGRWRCGPHGGHLAAGAGASRLHEAAATLLGRLAAQYHSVARKLLLRTTVLDDLALLLPNHPGDAAPLRVLQQVLQAEAAMLPSHTTSDAPAAGAAGATLRAEAEERRRRWQREAEAREDRARREAAAEAAQRRQGEREAAARRERAAEGKRRKDQQRQAVARQTPETQTADEAAAARRATAAAQRRERCVAALRDMGLDRGTALSALAEAGVGPLLEEEAEAPGGLGGDNSTAWMDVLTCTLEWLIDHPPALRADRSAGAPQVVRMSGAGRIRLESAAGPISSDGDEPAVPQPSLKKPTAAPRVATSEEADDAFWVVLPDDPASRLDRAAAQASRQQQAWAYWGRQQQEHGAVLRTCPLAPTILEVLCHEAQFRALDPPALHDTLPLYCATDPAPAVVQAAVAAMLEAGLLRRTDAGRLAVTLFGYQALARPVGLGLEAESCGERYRRLLSEAQREWQDAQRAVAAEEEAEAEGEAASRTMAEGEREPEELEEEEEDDAFEDELGTETEEEEVPFGGEEGPEGDDVGEGDPAEVDDGAETEDAANDEADHSLLAGQPIGGLPNNPFARAPGHPPPPPPADRWAPARQGSVLHGSAVFGVYAPFSFEGMFF